MKLEKKGKKELGEKEEKKEEKSKAWGWWIQGRGKKEEM